MDYLVFNEESRPFLSRTDCDQNLFEFFRILNESFKYSISYIRVPEQFNTDWYNLEVCNDYYVRNWLSEFKEKKEDDIVTMIKTIIERTLAPVIPPERISIHDDVNNSVFTLTSMPNINTLSLGVASFLNKSTISLKSHPYWNSSKLKVTRYYIYGDEELNKELTINNITQLGHLQPLINSAIAERKANCRKGQNLWENRATEFGNLIFCGKTNKQLKNLSINNATFDCLWDNMKKLNEHIINSSSYDELKSLTDLDFTDESTTVFDNPKLKRHRVFSMPSGDKKFFGFHIKNFPSSMRLHFLADYTKSKIYIGYFGKHLPL